MQRPLVLAVALSFMALAGCDDRRPSVRIATRDRAIVRVLVEVADTTETRNRGLMYRKDLAPDHGMLFLFENEANHAFWMKNTPLPLDMVFLGPSGHVVGIHENAVPFSLDSIQVSAPSTAVLEVAAGFVAKHGISVGDRASIEHVTSRNLRE